MDIKNDKIPEPISKGEDIINSTNQYGSYMLEDKDRYIQELEEEIIRLKEDIEKNRKYAEISKAFLGQSITAVAILDKDYNFIQVNELYAQADFRKVDDFPGHNHFEFYPIEGIEIFDNVVKTKETYKVSARAFIYPDHPERGVTYWDWTLIPVLDTEGEVEFLILNLDDVTKNVTDKAKLAESEERYRVIFENSLDGILLSTPDGTLLSANPAACCMFGCSEAELLELGRDKIVDLDDPKVEKALEKRQNTGSFYSEMTQVRKDGSKFPAEVTSNLFKDSKGRILSSVIIRDIIDRKKSEEALRWSQEKFSKAFDNNQAAMAITRLKDNRFIDVNHKYLDLSGYSLEELINKSTVDLWVDLHDREDMLREVHKVGYMDNFETKYRKKSGEIGYVLESASILDIDGEKYLLVSAIDITERKRTEEALRLSQEQFYKAFNANPLPMSIISIENGTLIEVNDTLLQRDTYASKREELIGLKLMDMDLWCDSSIYDNCIEEIKTKGLIENLEVKYCNKSGDKLSALLSGVTMLWKGKECILLIANDITELRRYELEITRLDRLNLIGIMSASIAHEIRNPMTTVKGFLQLFKSQDKYIEDREYMDLMIEEMDRANAIITEFLSLAKDKELYLKRENLNEKIMAFLPLIQADAMKKDIHIKLELEDIPDIMFDEAEIRQLLLNLVCNGLEAMSAGGELVIKTFTNRNEVTLVIQDQGSGIPLEVMDKIGTPFFTTKDNGTGLGVAVCYSIAQRHNARIGVETSSLGTIFKVIFPLSEEERTSSSD